MTLIVLFIIGAIADMYSTFVPYKYFQLEMNPIFLFLGKSWIPLVLMKIFFIAFVSYFLLKVIDNMKKPINQYFVIFMCIGLIAAQFAAAYFNTIGKAKLAELKGYKSVDAVPDEVIKQYVQPPKKTMQLYFTNIIVWTMLPTFAAFMAFALWEIMYFKRRSDG